MSMGVMLDASRRRPFSPFRSDLTTSLTPRLSCRAFEADHPNAEFRSAHVAELSRPKTSAKEAATDPS